MQEPIDHNQFDEHADSQDPIALRMTQEKPQPPFSESFAARLQDNLQSKFKSQPKLKKSFMANTMNKLIYGIGGALVVVIVVAVVYMNQPLGNRPFSDKTGELFG